MWYAKFILTSGLLLKKTPPVLLSNLFVHQKETLESEAKALLWGAFRLNSSWFILHFTIHYPPTNTFSNGKAIMLLLSVVFCLISRSKLDGFHVDVFSLADVDARLKKPKKPKRPKKPRSNKQFFAICANKRQYSYPQVYHHYIYHYCIITVSMLYIVCDYVNVELYEIRYSFWM